MSLFVLVFEYFLSGVVRASTFISLTFNPNRKRKQDVKNCIHFWPIFLTEPAGVLHECDRKLTKPVWPCCNQLSLSLSLSRTQQMTHKIRNIGMADKLYSRVYLLLIFWLPSWSRVATINSQTISCQHTTQYMSTLAEFSHSIQSIDYSVGGSHNKLRPHPDEVLKVIFGPPSHP